MEQMRRGDDFRNRLLMYRTRFILVGSVIGFSIVALVLFMLFFGTEDQKSTATMLVNLSAGPALAVSPIYRTGLLEEPRASVAIAPVAALADDESLFVVQPQGNEIVMLDSAGQVRRVIGGRGEAPGEFMSLLSIGIAEGRLFATDLALARVSFFDLAGSVTEVRSWRGAIDPVRTEDGLMLMSSVPFTVASANAALMRPNIMALATAPATGIVRSSARAPLLLLDSLGTVLDTVAWEELHGTRVVMAAAGSAYSKDVPFQDRWWMAVSARGGDLVVAALGMGGEAPTVHVARIAPTGDTTLAMAYRYSPVPLTEDAIDRAMSRSQVFPADAGAPPSGSFLSDIRESGLLPETAPAITGLASGQDGSIWLRREDDGGPTVRWTVLEPDGGIRGFVRFPASARVLAARGTMVVTVGQDDLGEIVVAGYRLG